MNPCVHGGTAGVVEFAVVAAVVVIVTATLAAIVIGTAVKEENTVAVVGLVGAVGSEQDPEPVPESESVQGLGSSHRPEPGQAQWPPRLMMMMIQS